MKDTFYFQHDYNARNDPKLQEVLIEHGVAGIGVFWCIVEQIYEQGGKLPFKSCKSIAFALHVECNVVESVVNDFDLFKNDGTFFWSNSILARMNRRKEISERRKKAAESRWKSEETQQKQCKSNAKAMQLHSKVHPDENKRSNVDEVVSNGAKATKRFTPPTIEEVKAYVSEKGYAFFDAERFIDFYTSKGWMVGKNKMKDWQAAVRNWNKSNKTNNSNQATSRNYNINDEWK